LFTINGTNEKLRESSFVSPLTNNHLEQVLSKKTYFIEHRMVCIPSTYPLPLVMLESMIKSLLSVIKELKTPEGGYRGF